MKTFRFKQFSINHSKAGHKVGTDAVLLGAWTGLSHNPMNILDIGTGSGIIALMLAQRSTARNIEAIEKDPHAFEECVENFENSKWNDRLFCYHGDIKEFAKEPNLEYDMLVCNPPFFEANLSGITSNREQARSQISLTYEELLKSVQKIVSKNGEFSIIIPYSDHKIFTQFAENCGLILYKVTHVKAYTNSKLKRSLMQFSPLKKPLISKELVLEISRHKYTEEFKNLAKDFYLKL